MSTPRMHGVLSTWESGIRAATQKHTHSEETFTHKSVEKVTDSEDGGFEYQYRILIKYCMMGLFILTVDF